jgi:hypothetical protein
MATCPVCGSTVDEEAAKVASGMTAHGASEIDPTTIGCISTVWNAAVNF